MKKRVLPMLLVSLLLIGVMAACQSAESAPPAAAPEAPAASGDAAPAPAAPDAAPADAPAAENITVSLGMWPEDSKVDEIAMHEQYVKDYNAIYPDVTLVPAYYEYAVDTFVAMAEAGTVPTIFQSWFTEPDKLIRNGFVADITDELAAKGWDAAMNPGIKDLFTGPDGRLYGLPRDGYALGMMINAELFEEAGLVDADGIPLYPKTMDELTQVAVTIREKTGSAGMCLLAKDNAGGWHFSNIAWNFGAELEVQGADGKWKANLNSPEAVAALQWVKDGKWVHDIFTADPMNEDWGTGFKQLGTGAAAMYIGANDAVDQPTYLNGLPVDKLMLIPIPSGAAGKQFMLMGGTPYMFSSKADSAQITAALNYLEIMGKAPVATDESIAGLKADAQYRKDNGIPVIPRFPCWNAPDYKAAEDAVIAEYSNVDMRMFQAYYDTVLSSGKVKNEEPVQTQDMYAELTKALQGVLSDKNADCQALLDVANANLQAILDDTVNK